MACCRDGDFNKDGRSDVLWESTSGNVDIWEMNGANLSVRRECGPDDVGLEDRGSAFQRRGRQHPMSYGG